MNETLNATVNATGGFTMPVITPNDLISVVIYLMVAYAGAMVGLLFMIWWFPLSRMFLKNLLGQRAGLFKWNYYGIMVDRQGAIDIHEYNLFEGAQFAEVRNRSYQIHPPYAKKIMGVPCLLYADQDTRPLTTIYEKIIDHQGNILYDVFLKGKRIKAGLDTEEIDGQNKLIAIDENNKKIEGAVIRERLKPFAWSHYDLYPPDLLEPSKIATGIRINRAENKIAAEIAARTSKLITYLILGGVALCLVFIGLNLYSSNNSANELKTQIGVVQTVLQNMTNKTG
jgi:hypothetical protein